MVWEQIYQFLGIAGFIDFISSPVIQEEIFYVKIVFILFGLAFLAAVTYFYINSSYLLYHVFQDVAEFISWQPYGLRAISKRWNKIHKKVKRGTEKDYKEAIMEADEFLRQTLLNKDYQGKNFEELVASAQSKIFPNTEEILKAHQVRNEIVYDSDYQLDPDTAQRILASYERVIKDVAVS